MRWLLIFRASKIITNNLMCDWVFKVKIMDIILYVIIDNFKGNDLWFFQDVLSGDADIHPYPIVLGWPVFDTSWDFRFSCIWWETNENVHVIVVMSGYLRTRWYMNVVKMRWLILIAHIWKKELNALQYQYNMKLVWPEKN